MSESPRSNDAPVAIQRRGRSPLKTNRHVAMALWTAMLAISCAGPLFKLTFPTHPLVAAGARLVLATALLSPWTLRGWSRLSPSVRRGAFVGGALYALHFGAWVWSLKLTTVAASVSLVTATPVLLALWSLVSGRDQPSRRLWLALVAASVGVLLIGASDAGGAQEGALTGDLLALLGAAAMAVYLVYVRALGESVEVLPFMGLCTAVGGVLLLVSAAVLGLSLVPAHATAWWALLGAAVVPQLLGHGLLTWSLRHTTPTQVGVATLGEPVGATLLAWALFSELPSWWTAAGCVCTGAAVLLATLRR